MEKVLKKFSNKNRQARPSSRSRQARLSSRSGQALIEAIAAIGIVVVGVMGALGFLSTSIGLNRIVTAQYTGTYLGAGYIEEYKNCLDTSDWDNRNFCFETVLPGGEKEVEMNGTNFVVVFDDSGCESEDLVDSVTVCATVKWEEKGDDFEVNIEDHFYNWR